MVDWRSGERILLVDDEEPLVELVSLSLVDLGDCVTGLTDPEEALAEFCSRPRDEVRSVDEAAAKEVGILGFAFKGSSPLEIAQSRDRIFRREGGPEALFVRRASSVGTPGSSGSTTTGGTVSATCCSRRSERRRERA